MSSPTRSSACSGRGKALNSEPSNSGHVGSDDEVSEVMEDIPDPVQPRPAALKRRAASSDSDVEDLCGHLAKKATLENWSEDSGSDEATNDAGAAADASDIRDAASEAKKRDALAMQHRADRVVAVDQRVPEHAAKEAEQSGPGMHPTDVTLVFLTGPQEP